MRYYRIALCEEETPRTKREFRNRAIATLEQEAKILDEILVEAAQGGVAVVPPLKKRKSGNS